MFDKLIGYFKGLKCGYSYNSVYKNYIIDTDPESGLKWVRYLNEYEMCKVTDYLKSDDVVIYNGSRYPLWTDYTLASAEARKLNNLQYITKMEYILSTNFAETKYNSANVLLKLSQLLMAKFPDEFKNVSDTGVFIIEYNGTKFYEKFGKLVVTDSVGKQLTIIHSNGSDYDQVIELLIFRFYSKSKPSTVEWIKELGILLNTNR